MSNDKSEDWVDLDNGIKPWVLLLRESGVETRQSCQGGAGHAYDMPTIDLTGGPGSGMRALSVCLDHGLPVMELRRTWIVEHCGIGEAVWQLVFRHDAVWWDEHRKRSDEDVRKYMGGPRNENA